MIQLTRLRHGETFYVNPDLFERVDTHVDTVVRLTNGHEYVVAESGDEIVRRIVEHRAQVLGLAAALQSSIATTVGTADREHVDVRVDTAPPDGGWRPPAELTPAGSEPHEARR